MYLKVLLFYLRSIIYIEYLVLLENWLLSFN